MLSDITSEPPQGMLPIHLTPINVFFGAQKTSVEAIELIDTGIKFVKVKAISATVRFNITIPPNDISEGWINFTSDTSTLILKTVPDSGNKIAKALDLRGSCTTSASDSCLTEGSLRIIIEFLSNGLTIKDHVFDFFSVPEANWKFHKIDYKSARQILRDLLELNECQVDYEMTDDMQKENEVEQIIQVSPSLNDSHKSYQTSPPPSLSPRAQSLSNSTSSPNIDNNGKSQFTSKKVLRTSNSLAPSMIIDIDIDDDDCDAETSQDFSNSSINTTENDFILTYPIGEQDAVTIYKSDLACLEDEQFLNDNILGFYLKYIQKELMDPGIARRTYIFSTFFYAKLCKRPKDEKVLPIADKYYNRVKNWTKNVDIFEKDFLIIPLNRSYHWFLAIVCYPGKVPESDEILPIEVEKNTKRPCILYMDSLQSANSKCGLGSPIRHFLTKEWENKKGTSKNFSRLTMPDYFLKVPTQNNNTDCGLFVLQYVEHFLRNPDVLLSKINSNLEDWFSTSLVVAKRRTIKRLIKTFRDEETKKNLTVANYSNTEV